jgi:hypothetical protein
MGSVLNLIGGLLYVVVAALAIGAGRRHSGRWSTIAIIFTLLAVWRFLDGEHALHEWAVKDLRSAAYYQMRRNFQMPLIIAVVALSMAFFWVEARKAHRTIQVQRAWLATLGLCLLAAVRAISWHYTDVLIFASIGPVHLNHVLDIGLTAIVGLNATQSRQGLTPRGHGRPTNMPKPHRTRTRKSR